MEPIPTNTIKSKHFATLLSVLVLVAIVTIVPHAFAQISYTDGDRPHGPVEPMAWAAGMAIAGLMSGVGVWTAIRRH
ncbi:MAG: hypothetical protein ACREA3_06360 [Nitrosotalea sp.]